MDTFKDPFTEFIFLRTYARYLWEDGRRETWPETVDRYCNFVLGSPLIPDKVRRLSKANILNFSVMPSMRALWTSGEAARQSNEGMYNCSFLAVDSPSAFGECLYLLMCGTGVGFSVEEKHITKLPAVKHNKNLPSIRFCVPDSRIGWKEALDVAVDCMFDGRRVFFDFDDLRPMGAPLRTMGGRSSGGDVLRQLLGYFKEIFDGAQGRKLTTVECHNLLCEIASIVVVGGTRRSALISLSDLSDEAMRRIKTPPYNPRLHGANNSAVYYEKPSILDFLDEWVDLAKSGQGERGIANLWAARKNAPHRRKSKLIQGLNPCCEIALRNKEMCNLTEVIIRAGDDFETLRDKLTSATWLGVIQSMFTYFPQLTSEWKENCEEERLIGVSLTGQMDNPGLLTPEVLQLSREHVKNVARKASKILGINMPAATTTTKPSGTVSQLTNASAGLHPRWAKTYLRNVQISKMDPLYLLMVDQGVPNKDVNGSSAILSFPIKSPDGAITRHDMTAIDQLEWYHKVAVNWSEHNSSTTIYVGRNEWLTVAAWVYDHFDELNGVSFFPKENGDSTYDWLPYQDIPEEEYNRLAEGFPALDYSRLPEYEAYDQTEGAKTYACSSATGCEI